MGLPPCQPQPNQKRAGQSFPEKRHVILRSSVSPIFSTWHALFSPNKEHGNDPLMLLVISNQQHHASMVIRLHSRTCNRALVTLSPASWLIFKKCLPESVPASGQWAEESCYLRQSSKTTLRLIQHSCCWGRPLCLPLYKHAHTHTQSHTKCPPGPPTHILCTPDLTNSSLVVKQTSYPHSSRRPPSPILLLLLLHRNALPCPTLNTH